MMQIKESDLKDSDMKANLQSLKDDKNTLKKSIHSIISKPRQGNRIQKNFFLSQFQKQLTSQNQMQRIQRNLKKGAHFLRNISGTYKPTNWLYNLKVKHQILFLTVTIIIIVTGSSIVLNQINLKIFSSLLGNGFNQILNQQNAKQIFTIFSFQQSVMLNYMSVTRTYFYNNQQMLMAISQIYNHALKSKYSVDKGIQCPVSSVDGKHPSYFNIDSFCYVPYGSADRQSFEKSHLNTEFIKLTSTLNQFILCFNFQLSYKINNYIQLNLDNQDEMISVYPQVATLNKYSPRKRPAFVFQKQQYNSNITKKFYITQYFKRFNNRSGTQYLQSLTLNLLNGTQFQGMVGLSIQFNVFDQIFRSFPDLNIALVNNDGTLLYQQTQLGIYNEQQFIYNQSCTGYNYLDWLNLQSKQDDAKQSILNNTLLSEPLKVNIKQFDDLPYYFIVYNNMTYENRIEQLQIQNLSNMTAQSNIFLGIQLLIVFSILKVCYIQIERIVKPINIIKKLIYSYNYTFKDMKKTRQLEKSNNIFDILLLVIYFKHSQLQNLSSKRTKQCDQIEELIFPIRQYSRAENDLFQYLQYKLSKIQDKGKLDWEN